MILLGLEARSSDGVVESRRVPRAKSERFWSSRGEAIGSLPHMPAWERGTNHGALLHIQARP
eukprot:4023534-Amphidinium_carterae.1